MAKLSIGLPVYNGARFLPASLEALLAQTYEDFELIVSDNGSSDETEEICREFAARDPRIRYLRVEENRGAAWNFNRVVRDSTGPYFRWATHDDLAAPTSVERCLEALEDGDDRVVLVYPRSQLIDDDGQVLEDWEDRLDLHHERPHERLRVLVQNLVLSNALYGVIRRSALERTRLLDTFPSADYVLLAELALLGRFHELPERLFLRRVHPGMSREAQTDAAEVAAWFDPAARPGRRREFSRLFAEHLRSIARMPLTPADRTRCFATFADTWLRRNGVHVAEELLPVAYAPERRLRVRLTRR